MLQPYTLLEQRNTISASLPMSSNDTLLQWARFPARLWCTLTSAISTQSLRRLFGKGGVREYLIDSVDSLNFLFAQDFRDLQILDVGPPESRVPDTSARVEALLLDSVDGPVTERDILAELQFTFLTGTHLGNPACLEQWWNLVLQIVLRAYSLAISHPLLAKGLLQTLFAQLFYTEHYVGSSSPSSPSPLADQPDGRGTKKDGPNSDRPIYQYRPRLKEKLRQVLSQYKRKLQELLLSRNGHVTPAQQAVGKVFEELEAWLWQFDWNLRGNHTPGRENIMPEMVDSDEEDDGQPVVVELDEEGREVGLVSFGD
ncbi:AAR2 protein-domain-containing protein [Chaetomium strumarium]|uniref:AAR2 protein-domain-containing protein n=1 Tax=Chaetomium strumarium TaxID=1170767 RepID=A0AAJ0LXT0_9PEZI|nr:AAR2 protein-domain-containing protein [Chaetomium strumarium]